MLWYSGNVKLKVYKTYLSAASYWLFSILILFLAIDQLSGYFRDFFSILSADVLCVQPNYCKRSGSKVSNEPCLDLPA
jgi:hypothetical protein